MTGWREHANCTTVDTDLFFMPDTEHLTRAERSAVQGAYQRTARFLRGVCSDCAVWQECRLSSLPELGGLWGGVTEHKRAAVRATYTAGDDGIGVEALTEQVKQALEDLDAGAPWLEALEVAGLDDHPFFHDFDSYGGRKPITRRLQVDEREAVA